MSDEEYIKLKDKLLEFADENAESIHYMGKASYNDGHGNMIPVTQRTVDSLIMDDGLFNLLDKDITVKIPGIARGVIIEALICISQYKGDNKYMNSFKKQYPREIMFDIFKFLSDE